MKITGSAFGGSGGARHGYVQQEILGRGHFVPMEDVSGTAEAISRWLQPTVRLWEQNEIFLDRHWKNLTIQAKQSMSKQWLLEMKTWNEQPRPGRAKL